MTTSSAIPPAVAATRPGNGKVAPSQARRRTSSMRLVRGVCGILALGLVIEVVSRLGLVNPVFLPPFSEVLVRSVTLWVNPVFLGDVLATVTGYVAGLAIASALAVVLGTLFGLVKPVYRASRTIVELLRPMPAVALIPLVLLILGSGLSMKIVLVVFAAIWPILFNTMYGVRDVDPYAKEMARSFGISRWGIVRRIVMPSAAPFIVTGIRAASSIALIVVITVELLAGGEGVGAFIARERAIGDQVVNVYAGVLIAGVLGLLINLTFGWVERRFFAWSLTTKGN